MANFEELWTGTNGDAWNSTRWPTQTIDPNPPTTQEIDIQSNKGRLITGTEAPKYLSVVSNYSATNMEGSVDLDFNSLDTGNEWLYFCIKGSGEVQDAQDGRPVSAYYFRFWTGAADGSTPGVDSLYGRKSNVEGSSLDVIAGTSRVANDPFRFMWRVEDDTPSAGTTRISHKRWDIGTQSDPGSWETVDDSSPGVLAGSGTFQLVARNLSAGDTIDLTLDNLSITDLDGPASLTTIINMETRKFQRISG